MKRSDIDEIPDLDELSEWYKVQFEILFKDKSRLEKEDAHVNVLAKTLMKELDNLLNLKMEYDNIYSIGMKMDYDTRILELQDYLDSKYKLHYTKRP